MIGYVMVGSNNIKKAMDFYDAVLAQIGLIKKDINEEFVGYSSDKKPSQIEFYLTKPFDEKPATHGNGTMVAFLAESREAVHKFHQTALDKGGMDEGAPGFRSTGGNMYLAYIRDFDGNKICAYSID
ncbi:MAG: glyoxalase [Rhodobacteraceae bacterium]|nr:glyoxalase [Paracoccaceae bacterium]|tara:strand:- start:1053 stop:1433 length:381 start_codon:yes stop_codon:yes gene_type:complete